MGRFEAVLLVFDMRRPEAEHHMRNRCGDFAALGAVAPGHPCPRFVVIRVSSGRAQVKIAEDIGELEALVSRMVMDFTNSGLAHIEYRHFVLPDVEADLQELTGAAHIREEGVHLH